MNRFQFILLNVISVLLVALLLSHFFLAKSNNTLSIETGRKQAVLNNARQLEPVLDQLAKRIAKGSEVDPRLRTILIKYGMTVTLDVDGKKKNYP